MSALLTLVQSPRPQAVRQFRLAPGEELVIGRGAEAGWRIDDPDQYVSRSHCTLSAQGGGFWVTDTSSGGLFVDGAAQPLGHGRPLQLRDGMRLRMGDYVLEVALRDETPARPQPDAFASGRPQPAADPFAPGRPETPSDPFAPGRPAADPFAPAAAPASPHFDAFFRSEPVPQARQPRPSDLPPPFEEPPSFLPAIDTTPPERRSPPVFDDPFTLDTDRHRQRPEDFAWDAQAATPAAAPTPSAEPPAAGFELGWDAGTPTAPPPLPPAAPLSRVMPKPTRGAPRRVAEPSAADADLLAAFLSGLGLDPDDAPEGDPAARMAAFGREYRMMAEGLMQLLRVRAQEKGSARIAQTVVGASEVNPLKFMPTVEDALAVMVAPRSGGFSEAEVAIAGALRDLAAHHVGTWRGTQAALRRMIDRFDPTAVEKELEELGLLEQLLAGGRRAKLWELYRKRFEDIARSAETRFLGEVGADFRDAYEGED